MLKIKDSVDLKELEKYGFLKWDSRFCTKYDYVYNCLGESALKIIVYKDKTIRITNISHKVIDVLYDLIKDGLIEKE